MPIVDLTGMRVSTALGVLCGRKHSGELRVVTTYRRATFQIVDGEVISLESDRPSDRLGLQMMRAGDIGVIDLHGALIEQHQHRLSAIAGDIETARLGEILVKRDVLNPDELADAIQRYFQSIVASLDEDLVLRIEFEGDEPFDEIVAEEASSRLPILDRISSRPQTSSLTPSE